MTVYGLDIGGTKIETAIFDQKLNLLDSWRVATPTDDYQLFLKTLLQQVEQADRQTGQRCRIGIGMPGLINQQGQVLSANVACATGRNIYQDLKQLLNRPLAIKNDTRCFALSEALLGAGKGHARVFGAILGTGAAGGMCIDGKLDHNELNIAGEYGHIPLSAKLQQKYQLPILTCGCGLTGCIESYISGPGIVKLHRHLGYKATSAKQWHEQLMLKDKTALAVLECYLDILGESFAVLVKLMAPDVIVIGGGLSHIQPIIDRLPQAIEQHLFAGFSAPKVLKAQFGCSSGVRGAALLGEQIGQ